MLTLPWHHVHGDGWTKYASTWLMFRFISYQLIATLIVRYDDCDVTSVKLLEVALLKFFVVIELVSELDSFAVGLTGNRKYGYRQSIRR